MTARACVGRCRRSSRANCQDRDRLAEIALAQHNETPRVDLQTLAYSEDQVLGEWFPERDLMASPGVKRRSTGQNSWTMASRHGSAKLNRAVLGGSPVIASGAKQSPSHYALRWGLPGVAYASDLNPGSLSASLSPARFGPPDLALAQQGRPRAETAGFSQGGTADGRSELQERSILDCGSRPILA